MTFRHTVRHPRRLLSLRQPLDGRVPNTNAPLSAWHQIGAFPRIGGLHEKAAYRLNLSRQRSGDAPEQQKYKK